MNSIWTYTKKICYQIKKNVYNWINIDWSSTSFVRNKDKMRHQFFCRIDMNNIEYWWNLFCQIKKNYVMLWSFVLVFFLFSFLIYFYMLHVTNILCHFISNWREFFCIVDSNFFHLNIDRFYQFTCNYSNRWCCSW